MKPRRALASVVALIVFALSSEAAAQTGCSNQTRADALEEEGRQLRERRQDAQALERFRQSHALCRGARALARSALAEGSLGMWVEAERDLSTALRSDDRWVRENTAALRRNLEEIQAHLGELELLGSGPAAEVTVNGRPAGAWPSARPFPVVAGTVTFEVRAPGHVALRRTVEVRPRTLLREQVSLVAETAGPRERPSTAPPVEGGRSENGWQRPLGWTSVALGAVGLGVGVAGLLHAQARRATYDGDGRCTPQELDAPVCGEIIDGVDTGRAIELAGFVAGGVFAVAGVVLLVTAPSTSTRRATAAATRAWTCAPAGLSGVSCAFRF